MVVVTLALMNMVTQYVLVMLLRYILGKFYKVISQQMLTKLSLKVIVNHLNQAIIIRSDTGRIVFCNHLGLNFIQLISGDLFETAQSKSLFFERLK